jgi:hypothetical protein
MLVFLKLVPDFGAEGIRTHALRRAKVARRFARLFQSLQNRCKSAYFLHDAFPSISGDLLGLLHGCCTAMRRALRVGVSFVLRITIAVREGQDPYERRQERTKFLQLESGTIQREGSTNQEGTIEIIAIQG